MKKIFTIFLVAIISVTAHAQKSGPTKEQTIDFIKDYLKDFNSGEYNGKANTYPVSEILQNRVDNYSIDFSLDKCKPTVHYNTTFSYDYKNDTSVRMYKILTKNKIIIDLKKIEEIFIASNYLNARSDMMDANLTFVAATGESSQHFLTEMTLSQQKDTEKDYNDMKLPETSSLKKNVSFPLSFYSTSDNVDYKSQHKKILQAFNHLRKLCGAPEPINFE
ncbi:hypothetical protein NZ698_18555 [Chryseobacterium sp. PBS4-4]|uniref:DUF3828 domain-containing protein n=1 Tax=Chryseobacterium edaphi TaxID=2976532 RepID=A0ABT2WB19_9FLAO|nr:hypothetical protein [Chryseobacterium edaphi]MCU7619185.1 hypothetical protein [Chryseobacterium edaphi]